MVWRLKWHQEPATTRTYLKLRSLICCNTQLCKMSTKSFFLCKFYDCQLVIYSRWWEEEGQKGKVRIDRKARSLSPRYGERGGQCTLKSLLFCTCCIHIPCLTFRSSNSYVKTEQKQDLERFISTKVYYDIILNLWEIAILVFNARFWQIIIITFARIFQNNKFLNLGFVPPTPFVVGSSFWPGKPTEQLPLKGG